MNQNESGGSNNGSDDLKKLIDGWALIDGHIRRATADGADCTNLRALRNSMHDKAEALAGVLLVKP
jgi:hypothetical protein